MFRKINKQSALLFAAVILGCIPLLSGCEKEEPPPAYFEENLMGSWCVREFYTSDGVTIIHNEEDCVQYQTCHSCKTYDTDNPAFCNLYYINNIQKWEIYPEGNSIRVNVSSICSFEHSFQFNYSELIYFDYEYGATKETDCICAKVEFVSADTTIIPLRFQLLPDCGEIWITYGTESGVEHRQHLCKL